MDRTFKYKIDRTKLKDSLISIGLNQTDMAKSIGKRPIYLMHRSNKLSRQTVPAHMQKSIKDFFKRYNIDADKIGLFYEVKKDQGGVANKK